VALKQILEKHADDPASRQRFVAEAALDLLRNRTDFQLLIMDLVFPTWPIAN
jgi:hypothetical protein